jgi:uncharacterized protein YggL (DUF469 family)
MNRRLRKKLHRGEFNTLGFEVRITFEPPLQDIDAFCDEFIVFMEENGLQYGGACGYYYDGFVTRVRRAHRIGAGLFRWIDISCTEADRKLVWDWIIDHRGTPGIGPLKGAW